MSPFPSGCPRSPSEGEKRAQSQQQTREGRAPCSGLRRKKCPLEIDQGGVSPAGSVPASLWGLGHLRRKLLARGQAWASPALSHVGWSLDGTWLCPCWLASVVILGDGPKQGVRTGAQR